MWLKADWGEGDSRFYHSLAFQWQDDRSAEPLAPSSHR